MVKPNNDNTFLYLDKNGIHKIIKKEGGLEKFIENLTLLTRFGFSIQHSYQMEARSVVEFGNGTSIEAMPAGLGEDYEEKIVSTSPTNPQLGNGWPTIQAFLFLYNGKTGRLQMMSEGTIPTAIRTAISSAIGAEYLTDFSKKLSLGIVGCGVQGRAHYEALKVVCKKNFSRIFLYDINLENSINLAKKICSTLPPRKHKNIIICEPDNHASLPMLVKECDLICTLTCKKTDSAPIIQSAWVQSGTTFLSAGGDAPHKFELDPALVKRSKLVVDFKKQAVYEGEAQNAPNDIYAELHEIVRGLKPGRTFPHEIIIFDAVGFPVTDYIIAKYLFTLAMRHKVGKRLKQATFANPYDTLEEL